MTHAARPVTAAIVLTGDELLRGFVQDANTRFIARDLRDRGVQLVSVRITGDGIEAITDALDAAAAEPDRVDLIITSGGLGPTHDDRTSEAVAGFLGLPLELRDDALAMVEQRLHALGRLTTVADQQLFGAGNRKQATVPEGAVVLTPAGTAPGYVVHRDVDSPVVVVLPGPPSELQHAWKRAVATAPLTQLMEQVEPSHERLVRVWGVAESAAARELELAGHVDTAQITVTLCARDGELEMSIRGTDTSGIDALADRVAASFGDQVFARDDDTDVASLIGDLAARAGVTFAVAESCTGGMLGSQLTSVAGSSSWFRGGAIVYSNELKVELAGVLKATLDAHGAVSDPVANELAAGIRRRCASTIGIGITGIAGPGGGSQDKPVGTVHVAIADEHGVDIKRVVIPGDRSAIRRRACMLALQLARRRMLAFHS